MANPLVSITSAFYNTGPMLLDMIKSVFSQTYSNWELILLDDGSTDDSLAIAESVNDERVKVYSNGINKGRAYSLNRLTELSNGKYIARMDSDDMCVPERIEKQVFVLESQPDIDAVSAEMIYLDKELLAVGRSNYALVRHDEICENPYKFGIAHGPMLARKSWLETYSYNEMLPYAVDFDLFLRSHKNSKFTNVPDPLYYYRLNDSFTLKKQIIGRHIVTKCLCKFYKNERNYKDIIITCGMQYIKLIITIIMFVIGMKDKLISHRFFSLSEKDSKFHNMQVAKIRNMELPMAQI